MGWVARAANWCMSTAEGGYSAAAIAGAGDDRTRRRARTPATGRTQGKQKVGSGGQPIPDLMPGV